ncbi:MAG: phosphoadenylyl-sulfate reductase [Myxococcaceae bacterium]
MNAPVEVNLEGFTPEQVVEWAFNRYGTQVALASSFGAEDVLLIDVVQKVAPLVPVFTLDTGRLHPDTYTLIERLRERYGLVVQTYFPQAAAVEALVNERGHFSFYEGLERRKECCAIRKTEPLERALSGRQAWITGLRREQSPTRDAVKMLERDAQHGGIAKLNPLAAWTEAQVWAAIRDRKLPYHRLFDQGYRSIGCAPCTRAVKPGENERAGRWWWEDPAHKECGLHR